MTLQSQSNPAEDPSRGPSKGSRPVAVTMCQGNAAVSVGPPVGPVTTETDVREGGDPVFSKRVFPRRSRRGISIFGVVLGVAVAALVTLGLVSAYQGVVTNTRAQAVLNTMLIMESTVRRTFANRPQFEAGPALQGAAISAVPTNSIQGSGATRVIVTPWGGNILIGAGNTPSATAPSGSTPAASNNRFYIVVTGLPEAACETIASAYLDRADVIGLDTDGTFAAITAAVDDDFADINDDCDSDDETVGIVFRG